MVCLLFKLLIIKILCLIWGIRGAGGKERIGYDTAACVRMFLAGLGAGRNLD